jgi:hypothetical protein
VARPTGVAPMMPADPGSHRVILYRVG